MLRITPQMASKWVKAAFLIILAIVILYFSSGVVDDLKRNSSSQFNVEFDWTWDLLAVLLWILVAWLLVDAVIIIVLSLRGDAYTLADVMDRLRMVEKRVAQLKPKTPQVLEQAEIVPAPVTFDEEEPPPPGK
ncbi:MAG: hypothetical protein A3K75_05450 [Euryarchaeota archaeon RBG_13_61_15]|jgi:hypothetical protein|nr:MAG: hypothetical protein A3K75_05450 [Euryarchaeota archaeon RBG_13_61_15]